MKKLRRIILIILMLIAVIIVDYLVIRNTHTWYAVADVTDTGRVKVTMDRDDVVEVTSVKYRERRDGNMLVIKMKAVGKGTANLTLETTDSEMPITENTISVDDLGFVTESNYLGSLNDITIIRYEVLIICIIMIINIYFKMRTISKESRYSYRLMFYSGAIVFLVVTDIIWLLRIITDDFFTSTQLFTLYADILYAFHMFALLVFPMIFILSIFLIVSNIVLMRHEGRNVTNMLGIALGVLLVSMTVATWSAYSMLDKIIDVHSYRGMHIEYTVESVIDVVLAYLECMMVGTTIWTLRAARYVPAFDKDYIIILGCSIRKDGTPTPLLRGRADRAIWFAKKQKEKTGKNIKFVASGGKGDDEVISESESITNYLVECGVPRESIIMEDKSTTTDENMKFSYQLIMEDYNKSSGKNSSADEVSSNNESEIQTPEIVFSTTGYHVFRSGHIAASHMIKAEGIGCRTKWYFYVNALIREFVANMNIARRKHIPNVIAIILIIVAMLVLSYNFKIL